MAVTFTVHLLQVNGHPIETAKAASLRTAYLHAHSICNLFLPIPDGRGWQQTPGCMRVLSWMGWIYPWANTIWRTLGFLLPMHFWSLIIVYDTILPNGVVPMSGTFFIVRLYELMSKLITGPKIKKNCLTFVMGQLTSLSTFLGSTTSTR